MPVHVGPHKLIAFARGHALIFKVESRSRDPEGKATLRGKGRGVHQKAGWRFHVDERRAEAAPTLGGIGALGVIRKTGICAGRTAGDG